MKYLEQEQVGEGLVEADEARLEEAFEERQVRVGLATGEEVVLFSSRHTGGVGYSVEGSGALTIREPISGRVVRHYSPSGWHWVEGAVYRGRARVVG